LLYNFNYSKTLQEEYNKNMIDNAINRADELSMLVNDNLDISIQQFETQFNHVQSNVDVSLLSCIFVFWCINFWYYISA
jgi:hypothetical protein